MVDLSLGTILAQMLNFFILVWLLARFAYKPLLAMMTERKERIAKDLEAAEKARVEAEGFKADYAAQIAKARQEAQQIVEKAVDFIPFFVGFTLAASLGLNLVSCAVISLIFAVLFYELETIKNMRATASAEASDFDDDDEEDI